MPVLPPLPASPHAAPPATSPAEVPAAAAAEVPAAPSAPGRDRTIDAVRALCLLVVVALHALMVGAETTGSGGLVTSVALAGHSWFVPVTWVVQVMPLFFLAGGFAGLSQWRRMRAAGRSAADYVLGRARRLTVPTAVMVLAVGAGLHAATASGADPELIAEAGRRIGQPLWFLAVYLGATALVPAMSWLHERRRSLTPAVLFLGAMGVDLARMCAELPLGYLNLVFVWLLMQQLGFWLRDGACAGWTRAALWGGAAAAIAAIALLAGLGWSADMLVSLNPPTAALALLGLAQFFLLQLLRPALDRLLSRPRVAAAVRTVGSSSMTVYLWHMPVVLLLTSLVWTMGLPMPETHSAVWWETRVPWLIAVAAFLVSAAHLLAGIEKWNPGAVLQRRAGARHGETSLQGGRPGRGGVPCAGERHRSGGLRAGLLAAAAVVLAIAGVTTSLLGGVFAIAPVLCAGALLTASVILSRSAR